MPLDPERRRRGACRTLRLALALLGVLAAATAGAAPRDLLDETPVADALEILVLDRELLAIDARGGGQTRRRLEIGENVLWTDARGRVGVVATDRRLLAVATSSAAWQEARLRRDEPPPQIAHLGGRVALLATNKRALGFDGRSGNLVESTLGPRESVIDVAAGDNVGVIVTDRRALGLSAFAGGFFSVKLLLSERIESLDALTSVATLTTSHRVLIFRAPHGSWEERRRNLR